MRKGEENDENNRKTGKRDLGAPRSLADTVHFVSVTPDREVRRNTETSTISPNLVDSCRIKVRIGFKRGAAKISELSATAH